MQHRKAAEPGTNVPDRLLYSLKEAAFMLSISKRSLAYLTAQGAIPIRKLGGRTLIGARELRAFANAGMRGSLIAPTGKGGR